MAFGIGMLNKALTGYQQQAQTPGTAANATNLLRQGNAFLNPMGSPMLQRIRRRAALRNAMNRRRRGATLAGMSGLDPSQARFLMARNEAGAGEDIATALNEGQQADIEGGQNWMRSLYMNRLGAADRMEELKRQERIAKAQAGNPILGGIGQLAGYAGAGLIDRWLK